MAARPRDLIAASPPQELRTFIELMRIALSEDRYRKLVDERLSHLPYFEEKKDLLYFHHFSEIALSCLLLGCDPKPVDMSVQRIFLHALIDAGLVYESENIIKYHWNTHGIKIFDSLNCLDNIMLGEGYIVKKYSRSVMPIFIRKGMDNYTGTGFLTSAYIGNNASNLVITAKHNVDTGDGIIFEGFGNCGGVAYSPKASDWLLHPRLDLAVMPVSVTGEAVPIYPSGIPLVLSRTITLGYPLIAQTDGPYLLALSGEINAEVTSYLDGVKRLIISNAVAPGNSGGPVIDDTGLCVGMVVQSFETQHEGGIVSRANAAIPASEIATFLTQCGDLWP